MSIDLLYTRKLTYEYIYTVPGGFCDDATAAVVVTIQPSPVADAGLDQVFYNPENTHNEHGSTHEIQHLTELKNIL